MARLCLRESADGRPSHKSSFLSATLGLFRLLSDDCTRSAHKYGRVRPAFELGSCLFIEIRVILERAKFLEPGFRSVLKPPVRFSKWFCRTTSSDAACGFGELKLETCQSKCYPAGLSHSSSGCQIQVFHFYLLQPM